jgi:predicted permease
VGLLLGKVLRRLWDGNYIPETVPIDNIFRWTTRMVFFVLSPIIIIGAFWFVQMGNAKLILLPILGAVCIVLGGFLAIIASKILKLDRAQTGSMFVSGCFTNMGGFGTLFCFVLLGEESLVFIAMFRLFEELIYYSVGFPIAKFYGIADQGEGKLKNKLGTLVRDPYILASFLAIMIGISLNLSPWERPNLYGTLNTFVIPLSTLLLVIPIGFNMKIKAIKGHINECLSIASVKFILIPLCMTALAYLLGLGEIHDGMVIKVIILLTAMPPAFLSLIPPQLYKLDVDLANSNLLFNSGLLILVLPIMYFILEAI